MKGNNCKVCNVAFWIVIIGAVNWGTVGLLDFNAVEKLFGQATILTRIVYGIVGLCGLGLLASSLNLCKACKNGESSQLPK